MESIELKEINIFTKRPPIIIPLERFEKTNLQLQLEKKFGFKHRTVFADVEETYYKALYKHGQLNIKIKTNLIPPQIYKFASNEVEIIN